MISGVIRPLIWAIIMVTLITTPLITTHEPASRMILNPNTRQPAPPSTGSYCGLALTPKGLGI